MTPLFVYKPENPDLLKAINKARLIPVKRMVRGKYGSYMAIRWVAPEDVTQDDQKIANPSRDELHAANADRSVESVMRRMNNMPKEYDTPDGIRTYIARVLQYSGGGHDAMNAVLEALDGNGVDIEPRDNVPATWARNLGKIQDYLSQHADSGKSSEEVKSKPVRSRKKKQSATTESSSQETENQKSAAKGKPTKSADSKTPDKPMTRAEKKQWDEEVNRTLYDTIRGVKIRKKAVQYPTGSITPSLNYAIRTVGADQIKDSIAALISEGAMMLGNSRVNRRRVDYVSSITPVNAYVDLPEDSVASEFKNEITYEVVVNMKDGTVKSGNVRCVAPPVGDKYDSMPVKTPHGVRKVTMHVLNDSRYNMSEEDRREVPQYIWEQLTSKNVANAVLQNLPDPDTIISDEKAELLRSGIIEQIHCNSIDPIINKDGYTITNDSPVQFTLSIRKSDDEWFRSKRITFTIPLKKLGLASEKEWGKIKDAKEYLDGWKYDHPGEEPTKEDMEEIQTAWQEEHPGEKMPGMEQFEDDDGEIPGQQELDFEAYKGKEPPKSEPEPEPEPEPKKVSTQPEDVAPIKQDELPQDTPDDGLDPLIDRNSIVNGLRLTNKAVAAVKKELPENCVIRSVGIFSATLDNESNQVNLVISAQVHNNETGYDYELPVYYPGMLGDAIDFIEKPTVTPKQAKEAIDDFLSTPSGQEMFNDEVSVVKKFSHTFDRLSPTVRDHYNYCFDDGVANHLPGLLEIQNYFDNPRTLEGTLLPKIWEQVQTSADKSKSNRFFDENFANVLRVTDFIDHCEMSEDTVMMQWSNAQCLPKLLGITDIPTTSNDWNKLIGYEFTNNSFTTAYGHDVDSEMKMKEDGDYDVVFMLPKGTKAAYIAPFADTPKTTTYEDDDDSVWDGGSVWNDKTTDYRSPTIIQRGTTFRLMGYKERKVKIGKGRKSIKRKVVYVQAVNQDPYKNDKFGKPPDDFYSSPYRWWRADNK